MSKPRLITSIALGCAVAVAAGSARAQAADPQPTPAPTAVGTTPAPPAPTAAEPTAPTPAATPAPPAPTAPTAPTAAAPTAAAPAATPAAPARTLAAAPGVKAADTPAPPTDFTAQEAERASFSGGRFVVGMLGAAVGGSLAAYGTYTAICGDDPCIGGALAGLGANMVATPVIAYGVGRLMGGRGTFSSTLWGALAGFGAGAPLMAQGNAGLIVGVILMPITAPLFFEISSNVRSKEMKAQLAALELTPYFSAGRAGDPSSITSFGLLGKF